MGISAQQYRVSVGLYNVRYTSCSGGVRGDYPHCFWKHKLTNFVDSVSAALIWLFSVVVFVIGMITISDHCYLEQILSIPTIKHPIINVMFSLCDITVVATILNRLKLKSSIIKVVVVSPCFTMFFLNILLLLISNPSLANP